MEKVVVITGSASGLGKGLKQRYLQDGNIVIGIDKNADDGDYVCDVSNKEEIKKTFEQIAREEKCTKMAVKFSIGGGDKTPFFYNYKKNKFT